MYLYTNLYLISLIGTILQKMTTNFLLRIRFAKDTLARKEYFGGGMGLVNQFVVAGETSKYSI